MPRIIRGIGPVPCRAMLVGEAPGEQEHKLGKPFVGASGKILDSLLWTSSMPRDKVYITNVYKCWPGPGNPTPTIEQIQEHSPLLVDELDEVSPAVVGAVGLTAAKWFLGPHVDMEAVHGLTFEWGDGIIVVPIYHPANAFYKPELLANVAADIRVWSEVLRGKRQVTPRVDRHPEPAYYEAWSSDTSYPNTAAVDTEGNVDHPWCATVSETPGTAILYRGDRRFHFGGHVVLHNSLYDIPVLRKMGVTIKDDQFTDTMILAYLLQLEPQGLKPLAYRHCAMEMHSYDELTREIADEKIGAYLLRAVDFSFPKPPPVLEFRNGRPHVKQPRGVEAGLAAALKSWAKGGSPQKWLNDQSQWMRDTLAEIVGPLPAFTLDDVPFDKVLHYACRDADATIRIYPKLMQQVRDMGLEGVCAMDHSIIPMAEFMQRTGMPADKQYLTNYAEELRSKVMEQQRAFEKKYTKGAAFNYNSTDQCAEFLFNRLGLASTRLTKSKTKLSTDDKTLKLLINQHPSVKEIVEMRHLDTIRGFAELLAEAVHNARITYQVRATRVVSGRLSTSDPNLMAIPVRSDLGKRVRAGFVAPPGRVLCSCDLSQIEVRLMAHISGDPKLLAIYREGRDVHAETAMGLLKCPPDKVKEKKYRVPAKNINFGLGYGITGEGLYLQLVVNGVFDYTVEDCDQMILDWYKLYHGVERAQELAAAEARRNGFVRDMSGRIRYLPNIHSPLPWLREEAKRQAFNHKVQGSAQMVEKRGMARFWRWLREEDMLGSVWPLLQIHDELIVECDEDQEPMVKQVMLDCMTAETDWCQVPIEAGFTSGKSWGELE